MMEPENFCFNWRMERALKVSSSPSEGIIRCASLLRSAVLKDAVSALPGRWALRETSRHRKSSIKSWPFKETLTAADPLLTNIVLMGMGEPLDNFENVVRALKSLLSPGGMGFSHRHVTLSTAGLLPEMKELGQLLPVNLAVSLNAADDATRNQLMPINRKYPLDPLIQACREFPLPHGKRITFEYILIKGVNDSPKEARALAKLLKGVKAKINLIPFNAHPGIGFEPPSEKELLTFQDILIHSQYTAIIRRSKGADISAACGQLHAEWTRPSAG